jgi:mono/diheme cytochrome c family protein
MDKRRVVGFFLILTMGACGEGEGPQRPDQGQNAPPATISQADAGVIAPPPLTADQDASVDAALTPEPEPECRPAQADPEPARLQQVAQSEVLLKASELFQQYFRPQCGACHSGAKDNGSALYVADEADLAQNLDGIIERMEATDLAKVMPPQPKILLSARAAPDAVLDLHSLLLAWRDGGKRDLFPDPRASSEMPADGAAPSLAAPPALAQALTNMGSCVPAARIIYSDTTAMDELDRRFAELATIRDLPSKLSETDLFTLDSEALARQGVISYAPAYTLWADDAKKMRYVRVPRGTSIAFVVGRQSFDIPENTRFYKTFAKEVTDPSGNVIFKKIETRLIVVRHNVERPGQSPEIKALYGTYKWNEDETEAILVNEPLANGEPFKDHLMWYVTNEQEAQADIEAAAGESFAEKRERSKPLLLAKKLARHYAIPGSERCVQCHTGGSEGSFVLAFSPLQIMRRPLGEGGVIEPAGMDELNQLERFISYGLITGITKEEIKRKLLPLEKSQGARSPRSNEELIAQGYMLGNCAHCHNPKGFASNSAPELVDLLNLFPSADGGGIFEFPLERFSPRIQRSVVADGQTTFLPLPYVSPEIYDNPKTAQFSPPNGGDPLAVKQSLAAPWRSLIYRNVETPFAYAADGAIFPHMPMNTPGFDCRAPRIMAEWMLSIPSLPKIYPYEHGKDPQAQPFREVRPGDPNYSFGIETAATQLALYRSGERATYCPDTRDIIDSQVKPPAKPVPEAKSLGIPSRPHWVPMDLTDPVGSAWAPRNLTWYATLVTQPNMTPKETGDPDKDALAKDQNALVAILRNVRLTASFTKFATTAVPLGLWKQKSGCDFSSISKVSALAPEQRPEWLAKAEPDAPLYMQSPGAAVFGMVCSNCHGKQADSRGRQADSLLMMTGGATRVANFRAGLFGPIAQPGANLLAEFGRARTANATQYDWAARYLTWMALGGTAQVIPQPILDVVGANPVLGVPVGRGGVVGANMLSVARSVCAAELPEKETFGAIHESFYNYGVFEAQEAKHMPTPRNVSDENGDADLWQALCSQDNPFPVRVYYLDPPQDGVKDRLRLLDVYRREGYPPTAPAMDQALKQVAGATAANLQPWCVRRPDPGDARTAAKFESYVVQSGMALCPDELFAMGSNEQGELVETHRFTAQEKRNWTLRGAVNAGLAVFTYLRDLTAGVVKPQIEYDRCELLSATSP